MLELTLITSILFSRRLPVRNGLRLHALSGGGSAEASARRSSRNESATAYSHRGLSPTCGPCRIFLGRFSACLGDSSCKFGRCQVLHQVRSSWFGTEETSTSSGPAAFSTKSESQRATSRNRHAAKPLPGKPGRCWTRPQCRIGRSNTAAAQMRGGAALHRRFVDRQAHFSEGFRGRFSAGRSRRAVRALLDNGSWKGSWHLHEAKDAQRLDLQETERSCCLRHDRNGARINRVKTERLGSRSLSQAGARA
jgi:hypothetical protein